MGKMKELFTQYQNEMRGNDEFIDDEYHFQKWCEELNNADSNDDYSEINNRIQPKYSDMDIESILDKVLGNTNPIVIEIKNELNNLNSIRNGYFD